MKIVWLINGGTKDICDAFKNVSFPKGDIGWVTSTIEEMRKRSDISLYILFPQKMQTNIMMAQTENIYFWGFYQKDNCHWKTNIEVRNLFEKIDKEIKPDVVHIWGTEFAHSLDMIYAIENKNKIVVHMQGLVSALAEHYMANLPIFVQYGYTLRDFLRMDNIRKAQIRYWKRGKNEIEILKQVHKIMGRTDWDEAHCLNINPNLKYYHCKESMRSLFFKKSWEVERMDPYTIFVTQGNYPIKGFHYLLEALVILRNKYPNVKVRVAGAVTVFKGKNIIKEDSYGRYIRRYIEKYHLEDTIEFIGYKSAEEMVEEYMHANVFVISSAIENSPNSLAEAMVVGTPIVAADVGGINCMIEHKKDGFLYQHNNIALLAHYVSKIFDSNEVACNLSLNAKERAKKDYDAAENVKQLLTIYEDISRESRGIW